MNAGKNRARMLARSFHPSERRAGDCKNFLFTGSDKGGERAAAIYTVIQTGRLNFVNSDAWLRNVLTGVREVRRRPQLFAFRAENRFAARPRTSGKATHLSIGTCARRCWRLPL